MHGRKGFTVHPLDTLTPLCLGNHPTFWPPEPTISWSSIYATEGSLSAQS